MSSKPTLSAYAWIPMVLATLGTYGQEDPTSIREETKKVQIRTWIQELGHEDAERRDAAEASLTDAPPHQTDAELEALRNSPDIEIASRVRRVLDRHFWLKRGRLMHPAAAIPFDAFVYAGIVDLEAFWNSLCDQSELGRRFQSPSGRKVVEAFKAHLIDDANAESWELIKQWPTRFGGPTALAGIPRRDGELAVTALVTTGRGAEPSALNILIEEVIHKVDRRANHRGVTLLYDAMGDLAFATSNESLLKASDPRDLKRMIDAMADEPRSLLHSPQFQEGLARLGKESLAHVHLNFDRYKEQILKNQLEQEDLARLATTGLDECIYAAWGLFHRDGLQIDRAFIKLTTPLQKRKSWPGLLSFPKHRVRSAAFCPTDAYAFASIPVQGRGFWTNALTVIEQWWPELDLETTEEGAQVKQFQRIQELFTGEFAIWSSPKSEILDASRPVRIADLHLGGALTMESAQHAVELSKLITEWLGSTPDRKNRIEAINDGDLTGHAFAFDPDRNAKILWLSMDNHVLFATSLEALQATCRQLRSASLGMASRPDFQRLLATFSESERGALVYLNLESFFQWAYSGLLKQWLSEEGGIDDELKATLRKLPKDPKSLFSGVPGSLTTCVGHDEGILIQHAGGLSPGLTYGAMSGIAWAFYQALKPR